jgi:DNA-binding CsgD family transcriptional regulator
MARDDSILKVIEQIYEAAVEQEGMDKLALAMARAFDTESGFISFGRRAARAPYLTIEGVPSATENFDLGARIDYAQHYHERNIWIERSAIRGYPAIILCHEVADTRTLLRSEWYDYCQRLDAFHCLGAQFRVGDGLVGAFGAHRPRRARAFDEDDRRKMRQLMPHLERALQVQLRLGAAERDRAISTEVLGRLSLGCIVASARGTILFANAIAESLIHAGAGVAVVNGKLKASDPRVSGQFERLVAEAAASKGGGSQSGGLLNLPRPSERPLQALISPLRSPRAGFGPQVPAAIVLLWEQSEGASASTAYLRISYGLTEAEAKLLAALASGQTVAEYAEAATIATATARTHLKRVLLKTGHHRQTDIVREISANPLFTMAGVNQFGAPPIPKGS